jgi:hypothetical protein
MKQRAMAAAALLAGVLFLQAPPALAQVDLISRDVISGYADLRLAASDGEKSWIDGGFGKTRYGGDGQGGWAGHAALASADIVWRPAVGFDLSGYVDAVAQPGREQPFDLSEALVQYKPLARPDALRWQVRAGLLYPDISMENDGPGWTPTRTLSPSAINAWVGEEAKVLAVEATVGKRWEDQEVSASLAVFSHDDTSGTLLSWRGWSFSDIRSTAFGSLPIPQVPQAHRPFTVQDYDSQSVDEIDGRPGVYGRVEWRAPGGFTANLFYYDNGGDRTTVRNGQWAWDTKFWNLGLRYAPDARTEFLAQAMTGRTVTGFLTPVGWRVDADFDAAYLLASRKVGRDLVTARVDAFDVRDHTFVALDNNNERGWAVAADWRHPVNAHLAVLVEALHVDSNRPARGYVYQAAQQAQTTLQTALKLSF